MPEKVKFDFSGYGTKFNVKCSDGRTIQPNAFQHMNGLTVPLVWRHIRDDPTNILGRAALEHREDGIYVYGLFNETATGQNAKALVHHKDITALSIYANNLVEKSLSVVHGEIREISLVVAGANPEAKIDYLSIEHHDGTVTSADDEAIIYSDERIVVGKAVVHADDEEGDTLEAIFETMDEKQKAAVYAIISQLAKDGEIEMSDEDEDDSSEEDEDESNEEDDSLEHDEGDSQIMKKNVFDATGQTPSKPPVLSHDDFKVIMANARRGGSMREAFLAHEAGAAFLEHAGTYGVGSDRANLELLFPDARGVTKEPTWISRDMEWVSGVLNGTRHVPFSRIKSLHADITADEARARGYVIGNLKVEEVFPILRRITTPHTVYKKQKLDRDDIIDITDFNIVVWLKAEMRVMLNEEIARAVLVSDGRDPIVDVDDHIPTANVRPVWGDSEVYCYHKQVVSTRTASEMIDDIITARIEYRGSGTPTCYMPPSVLTAMLLLKDDNGRRIYRSVQELAGELRVDKIVEVALMESLTRVDDDEDEWALQAIILNLRDYTIGADKGGEINFFDDFDIDYNQYKYLLETRISGALTLPKSAIVLEKAVLPD